MRAAAIAAAVVAADTATKLSLDVPPELLHDRPAAIAAGCLVVAAAIVWAGRRYPRWLATPAALIAAGAACNATWMLLGSGGPDPIIVTRGGSFVAFNLADVAIVAGGTLALARVAGDALAELGRRLEATR